MIIIFGKINQNLQKNNKVSKYPNTKGYKIIADILYDYIIKNDLHTKPDQGLYEADWIDVLKRTGLKYKTLFHDCSTGDDAIKPTIFPKCKRYK